MFEHHFGLRENPFPAGHLLKFMYPSREHQEARAHLRYGIENREPFLLITGEVGTGKTTSLYDALNEWGDRVAVALITNSALTRQEMLEEICLRFGLSVPPNTSKPSLMVALERHLIAVRSKGEHAVLMMDEAQNLSMDLLEEIRLLSNLEHRGEKLIQIFLVGQPELEAHLARHELRQLRQRITVHYRLNPLSIDETLGYIHHHINVAGGNGAIMFPAETCREIHRLTHGIPREINTLASASLIAAYADGSPRVTPEHVNTAAQEGDFRSVLSSPGTRPADVTGLSRPGTAPPAPPTPTPRPQVVAADPAATAWPPMPVAQPAPTPPAPAPAAAAPAASDAPDEEPYAAPPAPEPAPATYSAPPPAPAPAPYSAPQADPTPAAPYNAPAPPATAAPASIYIAPPVARPAPPTLPVPAAPAAAPPPAPPAPPASETPFAIPRFPGAPAPAWPLPGGAAASATPREAPPIRETPPAREAPPVRGVQPARETPPLREVPPARPPLPGRRERGGIAKGVVAAMRHSEMSAPGARQAPGPARPAPAPVTRHAFAAPPPPVPLPVPGRSARDEEPSGAEDLSGLPVRLRERLERELAREDSGLPPLRGWLIAATVVAALSVVLILMQRFGAIDVPLLRGPAGTQANHSSSDQPELQTSPGTNPSGTTAADTIAPVVAPPKPKPIVQTVATRAPASRPTRSRVTSNSNEVGGVDTPVPSGAPTSTSTAASTPAPASTTGYGVSVAAFLDDERANQERERLATATGFPAIVMPFDDAGTTMYQVVLGRWPSSRAAERAANGLMEQGVINEARVTKLPKQ